jgi:hypothetical protein
LHVNCFLLYVIEGKVGGRIGLTGRRGRRRKKLQDDLNRRIGYWKMKEEAVDRTRRRPGFGRGYGPVVGWTTKWKNNSRNLKRSIFVRSY